MNAAVWRLFIKTTNRAHPARPQAQRVQTRSRRSPLWPEPTGPQDPGSLGPTPTSIILGRQVSPGLASAWSVAASGRIQTGRRGVDITDDLLTKTAVHLGRITIDGALLRHDRYRSPAPGIPREGSSAGVSGSSWRVFLPVFNFAQARVNPRAIGPPITMRAHGQAPDAFSQPTTCALRVRAQHLQRDCQPC